jgi:hypothetical protein
MHQIDVEWFKNKWVSFIFPEIYENLITDMKKISNIIRYDNKIIENLTEEYCDCNCNEIYFDLNNNSILEFYPYEICNYTHKFTKIGEYEFLLESSGEFSR